MRAQQVVRLLSKAMPARLAVLVKGAPGIGKSEVVAAACSEAGFDLMISHPVVEDPTNAKGLPWADPGADVAKFLPFGELARAINATRPLTWFLDDIGQAPPAVQAAYMQLLLAREVGGQKISDYVTFVAATNRRQDRAGVSGILEPVKSRFATIVELEANHEDWMQWAVQNDVEPEVIAYLRLKHDALHEFTPSSDMKNSPSPRAWAFVSKLHKLGLDPADEMETYTGAVGEGRAAEFCGFLRMYRELPSVDEVLLDPKGAIVPTESSALWAIAAAVGHEANAQNFAQVMVYASRLPQEYGVVCVRDAIRRDKSLSKTKAWMTYITGPIGKAVMGM